MLRKRELTPIKEALTSMPAPKSAPRPSGYFNNKICCGVVMASKVESHSTSGCRCKRGLRLTIKYTCSKCGKEVVEHR